MTLKEYLQNVIHGRSLCKESFHEKSQSGSQCTDNRPLTSLVELRLPSQHWFEFQSTAVSSLTRQKSYNLLKSGSRLDDFRITGGYWGILQ